MSRDRCSEIFVRHDGVRERCPNPDRGGGVCAWHAEHPEDVDYGLHRSRWARLRRVFRPADPTAGQR